jgi:hypothetical protein
MKAAILDPTVMKTAILDPIAGADPTAGATARSIREHPRTRPRIVDPTDPCYGLSPDVRGGVTAFRLSQAA